MKIQYARRSSPQQIQKDQRVKKLPHHTGMTEIRLGISLIFLMRMMKKEMPPKKALGDSILQNVSTRGTESNRKSNI